jgi:hypothetical protein
MESLFKTIFFREERIFILNQYVILDYTCAFKTTKTSSVPMAQYFITFTINPTNITLQ